MLSPLIQLSNGLKFTPSAGFGLVIASQSPLPISSVAFGKEADLAGVIGVIMADADIFDLLGLDVDLRQQIDQAHLRRDIGRGHGVAGVPQQIVVAMLDEIAAEDELKFQIAIGIGVRETLVDGNGRLRRAAFEARERHVRRRVRGRRETGECTGAGAAREHSQYPIHCFPPLN